MYSTTELMVIAEALGTDLDGLMPHFRDLEAQIYEGKEDGQDDILAFNMKDGCIFYAEGEACTIYAYRPRQCRVWPYWEVNTESEKMWKRAMKKCPGMGLDSEDEG